MTKERREEINRAMRGEVPGLHISDDVREIIGDLTSALAWAEQQRDDHHRHLGALGELHSEAVECKNALRDELDMAQRGLEQARAEADAVRRERDSESVNRVMDISVLQSELRQVKNERDALKARLMSDQVKACVATLEGVTASDPPDLQELARTSRIFVGQYEAERDEARAKAADMERALEEINLVLDRYWGRS